MDPLDTLNGLILAILMLLDGEMMWYQWLNELQEVGFEASDLSCSLVVESIIFNQFILFVEMMLSRMQKFNKSEIDYQAAQKQLFNDFTVDQYLKENQLESDNIEAYTQLLNQLILQHNHKSHTTKALTNDKQRMHPLDNSQEKANVLHLSSQLADIQQKISKQMEITKELEKEIVETKKSLNLLKGDIGHLISRNQSAKLLSSKIVKVKIVAEDQLKRVSLALLKDREQIKLRNEMQQKFNKKLKNISNYEINNLSKLKRQFSQNFIKKKHIYQNLFSSELVYQDNESILALKGLNQQKNVQNRTAQQFLLTLITMIKEMNSQPSGYSYGNHLQFQQQMVKIFNEILSETSLHQVRVDKEAILKEIILEYNKIEESLKYETQFFNELLCLKRENQSRLHQCRTQINEVVLKYQNQAKEQYKINEPSLLHYQEMLKKFAKHLGTIFSFLSYVHKNKMAQNIYEEEVKITKKSSFAAQDQSSLQKPRKVYQYISYLHSVYKVLSSAYDEPPNHLFHQTQAQICTLYQYMLTNIRVWLSEDPSSICKPNQMSFHDTEKEEKEHHVYNKDFNEEQLRDSQKQIENNFISKNLKGSTSGDQKSKCFSKPADTTVKAERIKLLQNIDSDYYKIIKSTIKMQKENTRKNYEFLRSFKRTKYASRDNILQEKRFQSSFSNLFTKQINSNFIEQPKKFIVKNPRKTHYARSPVKVIKEQLSAATPDSSKASKNLFSQFPKARFTEKLKIALQFS